MVSNDKLDEVFRLQRELQQRFNAPINTTANQADKQAYMNIMFLALMDEVTEVMRETAWKNPDLVTYGWKKHQAYHQALVRKELADALHFFVNLCLVNGMTSQDLFDEYTGKNAENHERQKAGY